jgi:hypothetical protein
MLYVNNLLLIKENVMSIISLIDEVPLKDKDFEVSELEFNLAIEGETSVSLLSVASAGVSAHSGITVRITKKNISGTHTPCPQAPNMLYSQYGTCF